MEQGSGTDCPLRLHQCLLFLGREHSRPRLDIAQYRAMSRALGQWYRGPKRMAGGLTSIAGVGEEEVGLALCI